MAVLFWWARQGGRALGEQDETVPLMANQSMPTLFLWRL